jgi:hypothetical protein
MSNQQGDNPPSAAPAGAYGPGHTLLGEPAFAEEPAPAAFPPPAAPHAGAMVPATIVDAAAFVPQPQYPASPYAGGTAPAAGYGMPNGPTPPTVGYGAPAPNPYGAPPPPAYPVAPPRRPAAGAGGPPMVVIGLVAFAVIGGLTTFLALRGRGSSSENDKPIPTIDVPPAATVPSDPGPGAASGADPNDPPPVEPPAVPPPAATVPVHVAPKPTATAPKPTATTPVTPPPTATTKPPPTPTTPPTTPVKPGGTKGGVVLTPRHPPKTH